ncbi:MAG: molybdopterin cofactor-binding domain-containing protein [Pigmentiphaga sp.]
MTPSISRRQWLKTAGLTAGGLILGVRLPMAGATPLVANVPWSSDPGAEPNAAFGAYLEIRPDGLVVFRSPVIEMGQGAQSSLAAVLADELDADFEHVMIEVAPAGEHYQRPDVTRYQLTSGSWSMRLWYEPMRLAGAAAREMLVAAAAQRWQVAPDACRTKRGRVVYEPDNRSVSYGELAASAAALAAPSRPTLKAREALNLVGRRLPRLDLPEKVDGSGIYGIDVRVPRMAYAAIRQAPVYGAPVQTFVADELRRQPGIIDVLTVPSGVVVVAETWWQAKRGVEELSIQFGATEFDTASSGDLFLQEQYKLEAPEAAVFRDLGDVAGATKTSAAIVEADYTVPFLHHAPLEPMNCTAHVTDTLCELWVPTQCHTTALEAAQRLTGLPEAQVSIHATLLGGAFGRRIHTDFIEPAILAAQAVGRPVKLLWSREEDMTHGFHRPAMTARLRGTLGAENHMTSLYMRIVGPSVHEKFWPAFFKDGLDYAAVMALTTKNAADGTHYGIPSQLIDYVYQPTHVPIGYWRSVGASHNGFFMECFIDEMAHAASVDPGVFRRQLLRDSPRGRVVLDHALQVSGWEARQDLPAGEGLGLAFFEAVDSVVAQVAHVSLKNDRLQVHRIWAVIDCGQVINPDTVEAQMEGGIIQTLSATLAEAITIENGRCVQSNFHNYPILRMAGTPDVNVHIIESGGPMGGVGEAMVPTLAPAICNAIYAASGRRIRSLPLSADGLHLA